MEWTVYAAAARLYPSLCMNLWVLTYRVAWIALAVLVLIAAGALFYPQVRQYQEYRRKETLLQEDVRMEEELLRTLKTQQERLQSDPRFVEKVAREEFGYAKPGETIFKFSDDTQQTSTPRRAP